MVPRLLLPSRIISADLIRSTHNPPHQEKRKKKKKKRRIAQQLSLLPVFLTLQRDATRSMSSPAGVRLPVCIFCRFISHNPTTPTARRRLGPKTATRYESTRVHIPKQYGHNVGRTPEKIVEDLYFKKIIRSQLEPAVVVPDYPSSSRTTRDLRMGRFYELGPAGMIKDVLEHDIPEDYYWPNPRLPPAVVWEGRWQDIDWGGIEGIPRGYKSKRGELLKVGQ